MFAAFANAAIALRQIHGGKESDTYKPGTGECDKGTATEKKDECGNTVPDVINVRVVCC